MGRESEEQFLVGGEMVKDRRQKSSLRRRRPQIFQTNAGQSQKTVKPLRIRGQKA